MPEWADGVVVSKRSSPDPGPTLRAIPFVAGDTGGGMKRLLTDKQRQELLSLSTRLDVTPRRIIYREGGSAGWVFICRDGALKAFRDLPSGKRRVAAFLFDADVFGLAERGRYVNTVQAITAGTCYRLPIDALTVVLRRDAELEFQFLCKVTHALRESQRRGIILGRRSASGRFAMFLRMLERTAVNQPRADTIAIPMSRSDIASYVGLSHEAVSRATGKLAREGIVQFQGAHAVRILDRPRYLSLAADL